MVTKKKKKSIIKKSRANRLVPEDGVKTITGASDQLQAEITKDMIYLFRSYPDTMRSPQIATETIIKTVLPTEKIAMEPEFEDIFGDPIDCVSIYSETLSKMEVNWESFGNLPPQLASSIKLQILEETSRQFMTESLRFEIMDGLNRYRLRKKRSGNKLEAGIAAAIQWVLNDEKNNPLWPKIGLIHGIIHNSISIGLEIKNSYKEFFGENKEMPLVDGPQRDEVLKEASSKIGQNPRLNRYFKRRAEKIYEEGINAVLDGNLNFGFLTSEELNKIREHIDRLSGSSSSEYPRSANAILTILTQKRRKKLISVMETFIHETFTPEKIDQMVQKLNSILKDPGDLERWQPFIILTRNYLQSDHVLEKHKKYFIYLTFGELAGFRNDSQNL